MKVRHTTTRTVEQEYSYIYSPTVWGFPKAPWTREGECKRVPTLEDVFDESFVREMSEWWRLMSYKIGSLWQLKNG